MKTLIYTGLCPDCGEPEKDICNHSYCAHAFKREPVERGASKPIEEAHGESEEDMLGEILENYRDYKNDIDTYQTSRTRLEFIREELEKFAITRKKE